MSLVARHLESLGIPTVIIGSARDIIEHCAVPRFLFVDYPLGNSCGKPNDREDQAQILDEALHLLETATMAETTIKSAARWGDDDWRESYMTMDEAKNG